MWWWRKVRWANIPDDMRAKLEQFGETVIAMSLSTGIVRDTGQLGFLQHSWPDALAWLQERRDIHERKEQRQETVGSRRESCWNWCDAISGILRVPS